MAIKYKQLGLLLITLSGMTHAMTPAQPVELRGVDNEFLLCLINPRRNATIPETLTLNINPYERSGQSFDVITVRKSKWCYKLEPADLLREEHSAVMDVFGAAAGGKIRLRLAVRCNPERDSCLMFQAAKYYSTQSKEDYEELLELQRRAREEEKGEADHLSAKRH